MNKIRRNDEEFINYLVDVRGTKKEKSEQRSKSKMKTVIKKIIRCKHKRAIRINSEKKRRSNIINIKAIVHRPMKSPSKLDSSRPIPVDPGEEPPCPNWVEQEAGGPTARIISGGQGEAFPHKESNLESSLGILKLQLKSPRMKLDMNRLQKVMTNFPGLKSEAQLKEMLLQEAKDEELWIDWRQGKDLRDEETHLSTPSIPPTSSANSPLDL